MDELINQDKVVGDPQAIKAGKELGAKAAASIIAMRGHDHVDITEPTVTNIQPPLKVGEWQKDPLNEPTVALGGYWDQVTPFVIPKADAFRAPPPPNWSDPKYLDQAKRLGRDPNAQDPMRFPTK